MLELRGM